ncbi:MAG: hypothetical protein LBS60_08875 [Deltaproteobacteria bacterium]|jgi:hypothetical protein|nr:hypothetical protein [Deltaproteobacteria bacterium]
MVQFIDLTPKMPTVQYAPTTQGPKLDDLVKLYEYQDKKQANARISDIIADVRKKTENPDFTLGSLAQKEEIAQGVLAKARSQVLEAFPTDYEAQQLALSAINTAVNEPLNAARSAIEDTSSLAYIGSRGLASLVRFGADTIGAGLEYGSRLLYPDDPEIQQKAKQKAGEFALEGQQYFEKIRGATALGADEQLRERELANTPMGTISPKAALYFDSFTPTSRKALYMLGDMAELAPYMLPSMGAIKGLRFLTRVKGVGKLFQGAQGVGSLNRFGSFLAGTGAIGLTGSVQLWGESTANFEQLYPNMEKLVNSDVYKALQSKGADHDKIMKAFGYEDITKNPAYQELIKNGLTPEQARLTIRDMASDFSAVMGFITNGVFGAVLDKSVIALIMGSTAQSLSPSLISKIAGPLKNALGKLIAPAPNAGAAAGKLTLGKALAGLGGYSYRVGRNILGEAIQEGGDEWALSEGEKRAGYNSQPGVSQIDRVLSGAVEGGVMSIGMGMVGGVRRRSNPLPPPTPQGTNPQGPGTQPQGPGTQPQGPGPQPQGPGTQQQLPGPGPQPQGPGPQPQLPGPQPQLPGPQGPSPQGPNPQGPNSQGPAPTPADLATSLTEIANRPGIGAFQALISMIDRYIELGGFISPQQALNLQALIKAFKNGANASLQDGMESILSIFGINDKNESAPTSDVTEAITADGQTITVPKPIDSDSAIVSKDLVDNLEKEITGYIDSARNEGHELSLGFQALSLYAFTKASGMTNAQFAAFKQILLRLYQAEKQLALSGQNAAPLSQASLDRIMNIIRAIRDQYKATNQLVDPMFLGAVQSFGDNVRNGSVTEASVAAYEELFKNFYSEIAGVAPSSEPIVDNPSEQFQILVGLFNNALNAIDQNNANANIVAKIQETLSAFQKGLIDYPKALNDITVLTTSLMAGEIQSSTEDIEAIDNTNLPPELEAGKDTPIGKLILKIYDIYKAAGIMPDPRFKRTADKAFRDYANGGSKYNAEIYLDRMKRYHIDALRLTGQKPKGEGAFFEDNKESNIDEYFRQYMDQLENRLERIISRDSSSTYSRDITERYVAVSNAYENSPKSQASRVEYAKAVASLIDEVMADNGYETDYRAIDNNGIWNPRLDTQVSGPSKAGARVGGPPESLYFDDDIPPNGKELVTKLRDSAQMAAQNISQITYDPNKGTYRAGNIEYTYDPNTDSFSYQKTVNGKSKTYKLVKSSSIHKELKAYQAANPPGTSTSPNQAPESGQASESQSPTRSLAETLTDRLVNEGGFSAEEATPAATLVAATLQRQADYLGVDPALILNDIEISRNAPISEVLDNVLNQIAYHGTAATNIEKFDYAFLSTGEGGQAFGRGFYFTEIVGLARHYKDIALRKNKYANTQHAQALMRHIYDEAVSRFDGSKEAARELAPSFLQIDSLLYHVIKRERKQDGKYEVFLKDNERNELRVSPDAPAIHYYINKALENFYSMGGAFTSEQLESNAFIQVLKDIITAFSAIEDSNSKSDILDSAMIADVDETIGAYPFERLLESFNNNKYSYISTYDYYKDHPTELKADTINMLELHGENYINTGEHFIQVGVYNKNAETNPDLDSDIRNLLSRILNQKGRIGDPLSFFTDNDANTETIKNNNLFMGWDSYKQDIINNSNEEVQRKPITVSLVIDNMGTDVYSYHNIFSDIEDILLDRVNTQDFVDYWNIPSTLLISPNKGMVYAVTLPEDTELLAWDEPLSAQPPKVKQAIANIEKKLRAEIQDASLFEIFNDNVTGAEFYRGLTSYFNKGSRRVSQSARTNELFMAEGIPGHRFYSGSTRHTEGEKKYNFVIWDTDRITEITPTQFQGENDVIKGYINFKPSGLTSINFTDKADVSTIIHEFNHDLIHRALNALRYDQVLPEFRQTLERDMDTLAQFAGLESWRNWNNDAYEVIAQAFERYVREGKAPNSALEAVFKTLKKLLIQIYKSVTELGKPLTPEVREVFDRMLAESEASATPESESSPTPETPAPAPVAPEPTSEPPAPKPTPEPPAPTPKSEPPAPKPEAPAPKPTPEPPAPKPEAPKPTPEPPAPKPTPEAPKPEPPTPPAPTSVAAEPKPPTPPAPTSVAAEPESSTPQPFKVENSPFTDIVDYTEISDLIPDLTSEKIDLSLHRLGTVLDSDNPYVYYMDGFVFVIMADGDISVQEYENSDIDWVDAIEHDRIMKAFRTRHERIDNQDTGTDQPVEGDTQTSSVQAGSSDTQETASSSEGTTSPRVRGLEVPPTGPTEGDGSNNQPNDRTGRNAAERDGEPTGTNQESAESGGKRSDTDSRRDGDEGPSGNASETAEGTELDEEESDEATGQEDEDGGETTPEASDEEAEKLTSTNLFKYINSLKDPKALLTTTEGVKALYELAGTVVGHYYKGQIRNKSNFEELQHEAAVRIIEALRKNSWDPNKGKLTTWLFGRGLNGIQDYFRSVGQASTIYLPQHLAKIKQRIGKALSTDPSFAAAYGKISDTNIEKRSTIDDQYNESLETEESTNTEDFVDSDLENFADIDKENIPSIAKEIADYLNSQPNVKTKVTAAEVKEVLEITKPMDSLERPLGEDSDADTVGGVIKDPEGKPAYDLLSLKQNTKTGRYLSERYLLRQLRRQFPDPNSDARKIFDLLLKNGFNGTEFEGKDYLNPPTFNAKGERVLKKLTNVALAKAFEAAYGQEINDRRAGALKKQIEASLKHRVAALIQAVQAYNNDDSVSVDLAYEKALQTNDTGLTVYDVDIALLTGEAEVPITFNYDLQGNGNLVEVTYSKYGGFTYKSGDKTIKIKSPKLLAELWDFAKIDKKPIEWDSAVSVLFQRGKRDENSSLAMNPPTSNRALALDPIVKALANLIFSNAPKNVRISSNSRPLNPNLVWIPQSISKPFVLSTVQDDSATFYKIFKLVTDWAQVYGGINQKGINSLWNTIYKNGSIIPSRSQISKVSSSFQNNILDLLYDIADKINNLTATYITNVKQDVTDRIEDSIKRKKSTKAPFTAEDLRRYDPNSALYGDILDKHLATLRADIRLLSATYTVRGNTLTLNGDTIKDLVEPFIHNITAGGENYFFHLHLFHPDIPNYTTDLDETKSRDRLKNDLIAIYKAVIKGRNHILSDYKKEIEFFLKVTDNVFQTLADILTANGKPTTRAKLRNIIKYQSESLSSGYNGLFYPYSKIIAIDPNAPNIQYGRALVTLLHETGHFIQDLLIYLHHIGFVEATNLLQSVWIGSNADISPVPFMPDSSKDWQDFDNYNKSPVEIWANAFANAILAGLTDNHSMNQEALALSIPDKQLFANQSYATGAFIRDKNIGALLNDQQIFIADHWLFNDTINHLLKGTYDPSNIRLNGIPIGSPTVRNTGFSPGRSLASRSLGDSALYSGGKRSSWEANRLSRRGRELGSESDIQSSFSSETLSKQYNRQDSGRESVAGLSQFTETSEGYVGERTTRPSASTFRDTSIKSRDRERGPAVDSGKPLSEETRSGISQASNHTLTLDGVTYTYDPATDTFTYEKKGKTYQVKNNKLKERLKTALAADPQDPGEVLFQRHQRESDKLKHRAGRRAGPTSDEVGLTNTMDPAEPQDPPPPPVPSQESTLGSIVRGVKELWEAIVDAINDIIKEIRPPVVRVIPPVELRGLPARMEELANKLYALIEAERDLAAAEGKIDTPESQYGGRTMVVNPLANAELYKSKSIAVRSALEDYQALFREWVADVVHVYGADGKRGTPEDSALLNALSLAYPTSKQLFERYQKDILVPISKWIRTKSKALGMTPKEVRELVNYVGTVNHILVEGAEAFRSLLVDDVNGETQKLEKAENALKEVKKQARIKQLADKAGLEQLLAKAKTEDERVDIRVKIALLEHQDKDKIREATEKVTESKSKLNLYETILTVYDAYQATGKPVILTKAQADTLRQISPGATANEGYIPPVAGGISLPEAARMWKDFQKNFTDAELTEMVEMTTKGFERLNLELLKKGLKLREEQVGGFDFTAYVPLSTYIPNPMAENNQDSEHIANPAKLDYSRNGSLTRADGALNILERHIAQVALDIGHRDFTYHLNKLYELLEKSGNTRHLERVELKPNSKASVKESQRAAALALAPGYLYKEKTVDDKGQVTTKVYKITYLNPENEEETIAMRKAMSEFQNRSKFLATMANFNKWTGQWFTKARALFSPVASFKDFGERSVNMFARGTYFKEDGTLVQGPEVLATQSRLLMNPDLMSVYAAAQFGRELPNNKFRQYWKELQDSPAILTWLDHLSSTSDQIISKRERSALEEALIATKSALKIDKAIEGVNWYNNLFNTFPIFLQYVAFRESQVARKDAEAYTLDAMNYFKRGTIEPVGSAMFVFFRAIVQGGANMLRAFNPTTKFTPMERARGSIAGAGLLFAGLMLTSFLRGMSDDDDDDKENPYDALPLNTISNYMCLFQKDGTFLKVPIPFGVPHFMWTMAQVFDRFGRGQMSAPDAIYNSIMGFHKQILPDTFPAWQPTDDIAAWIFQTFAPQAIRPFMDVAVNKNYWGGTLNYGNRAPGIRDFEKGRTGTPEVWHNIAAWLHDNAHLDVTPETVRHILQYYAYGPFQGLVAAMEASSLYDPEFTSTRQDIGPLGTALGASILYGARPNVPQTLYFREKRRIEEILTDRGIRTTSPDTKPGEKADLVSKNMRKGGMPDSDIRLYLKIIEVDKELKKVNETLRDQVKKFRGRDMSDDFLKNAFKNAERGKQNLYESILGFI